MSELELIQRRFERERAARKEAESLLEKKSREVFEANQSLQEHAEQTRAIVETAAEGIITYDDGGAIHSLNRSARITFQREEVDGLHVDDLFELPQQFGTLLFRSNVGDENDVVPEPTEVIGIKSTGGHVHCGGRSQLDNASATHDLYGTCP